jgi:cell division control protein 6
MTRKEGFSVTLRRSIFKANGLEKLSTDYLPFRLPHRETHEGELLRLFTPAVLSGGALGRNVLICGASGTGKTVTARKVALRLQQISAENMLKLRCAHINCRYASSNYGLVQMLANRTMPEISTRGYGASELLQGIHSYLDEGAEFLFIVLDDFDQFLKRHGPDILYDLMRLPDASPEKKNRILLLLIGVEDLSELELENWARSSITRMSQHFSPYSYEEIRDILNERVEESFIEGAVLGDIALLVSRIVERFGFGSARYGIELLQASGLEAECEGAGSICAEYVRRAQARMESIVDLNSLSQLPPGHILAMRAIAQAFSETERSYVPVSRVLARIDKSQDRHEGGLERLRRLHFEGLIDQFGDEMGLVGTTLKALEDWLAKQPEG